MTEEKALSIANEIDCSLTSMTACDLVEEIYSDELDNNLNEVIEEQELTIMWLCGYIMELHDFRDGIFKVNKETKSLDEVIDYVICKFPQLQGTSVQNVFRKLGDILKDKSSNKTINVTMDRLRKKHLE